MVTADAQQRIASGMQMQLQRFHAALREGMPRVGWKIGITDPLVQRKFGIDAPVIGWLHGGCVIDNGGQYRIDGRSTLLAEAEIAIQLAQAMPATADEAQALASIASLAPAIELIDTGKPADGLDVILGHSIFHEAVVFGVQTAVAPDKALDEAWPVAFCNEHQVRARDPRLAPAHLVKLVQLVAGILQQYGEGLNAGDRIISGSFIKPLPIAGGDQLRIDFGSLGEVCVAIS